MKRILILFFAFALIFLGYGLKNVPEKQVKTEGRDMYYTLKDATGDILSANITIINQVIDKETGKATDIIGPSYDFSQDDLKKLNDALSLKDGVRTMNYAVKMCVFHADYKIEAESTKGKLDIDICFGCYDVMLMASFEIENSKSKFQLASMTKEQGNAFKSAIVKFHKDVMLKR